MNPLPVQSIKLEVGAYSGIKHVASDDQYLIFDVPLQAGDTHVKGTMLDADGRLIAGAYYVYIRKS